MSESAYFLKTTKNILLSEPFTYEGRKAMRSLSIKMTDDDFYNDSDEHQPIYVKPFTEIYKSYRKTRPTDPGVPYFEDMNLQALETQKAIFEDNLKKLSDALFVIKGVAGSGKTTYLHKLQYQYHDDIDFHIWNFEETKQSFDFMNSYHDFETEIFSNNVYKFISILLMEIARILKKANLDETEHQQYIGKIVHHYYENFFVSEEKLATSYLDTTNMDTKQQKEFFDFLSLYANNQINYEELSEKIRLKLDDFICIKTKTAREKVSFIVGFIIRLYFCIAKITNKKQLCVVDNIEVFIKCNDVEPIQVCELEEIILGCHDAARSIRAYLMPIQNVPNYKTFYGFLIVTRDSTASTALINMRHYDDFKTENEINISNWYCMEDIYSSKKRYYENMVGELKDNSYSKAYEIILTDFSQYKWGLNKIVTQMYKHSHRRIIECVTEALASLPQNEIEFFNDMWTNISKLPQKGPVKTMCRKYIFRILLDHVQKTDYFDKLLVKNPPANAQKRTIENHINHEIKDSPHSSNNSLARKITTTLHCYKLEHGDENYMSFQQLIKILFKKPYLPNNVTNTMLKDLARILFLMNETRSNITNWTSLVCIRFENNQVYNENQLFKVLKQQWDRYNQKIIELDDSTDYGVRITTAGSFFSRFVSEFEYFACRYLSNEPPLLSYRNLQPITVNNMESFRCVEIIKIVREKVFSCLKDVIISDYKFYSSTNKNTSKNNFLPMFDSSTCILYKDYKNIDGKVHPSRVVNHHKNYIHEFNNYISMYAPDKFFSKPEDREKIQNLIEIELEKYSSEFNALKETYPEYFE